MDGTGSAIPEFKLSVCIKLIVGHEFKTNALRNAERGSVNIDCRSTRIHSASARSLALVLKERVLSVRKVLKNERSWPVVLVVLGTDFAKLEHWRRSRRCQWS